MYNSQMPHIEELPTSAQLIRSTLIAAVGASALLVMVVLPSEYAIDPTGIGRVLGLTQMGEIKVQLASEAKADIEIPTAPTLQPTVAASPAMPAAVLAPASPSEAGIGRSDVMQVELAPGQAAEIKVTAAEGAQIDFDWSVSGGRVNYDTHGDGKAGAPRSFYHGYGKGKDVAGDRGRLVAAFDGSHGWFWRNRSGATVTVTLRAKGGYTAIKRVA